MDQNLLYMFEFVIDDLLITHPNECAPEEYPTCVELTFRSSIFVQIYDSGFDCSNTDSYYTSKGEKCCLFSLDSQITENDKLHIHVYKKKVEKCKFLLGAAEISLKNMFDRVTNEFRQINTSFEKKSDETMKQEEYCPSSEIEKKLLSLIDSQTGRQTGNMVIIIRLSCMGPTIVSPFPFRKGCGRSSGGGATNDDELNRARGGENNIVACSPIKIPYLYKMKSHNMTKPKYHQNNTNNNNRGVHRIVRTYKRRTQRPIIDESIFKLAIKAVKRGKSIRAAAEEYNIAKSTLADRLKMKKTYNK